MFIVPGRTELILLSWFIVCCVWLGGVAVGFAINSLRVRIPAVQLSSATLAEQVVNTRVPLSPSSIIWYKPMGGDAFRWPRVTDIGGSPPTGDQALGAGYRVHKP